MSWIETGEHVRLVLVRIGAAGQELAPAVLDDPRVVAGCEPRRSGAASEREQLREAEAPVAARTGIRRLAPRVPLDERTHDCQPEGFTRVERDVRDAACVTSLARSDHRLGRAAGALRRGGLGVDPEPEGDADRCRAGPEERDRAVDAAAHRHRDPVGVRLGPEDRPDRVGQRVDGEALAARRRPPRAASGRRASARAPRRRPPRSGHRRRRAEPKPTRRREWHLRSLRSSSQASSANVQAAPTLPGYAPRSGALLFCARSAQKKCAPPRR